MRWNNPPFEGTVSKWGHWVTCAETSLESEYCKLPGDLSAVQLWGFIMMNASDKHGNVLKPTISRYFKGHVPFETSDFPCVYSLFYLQVASKTVESNKNLCSSSEETKVLAGCDKKPYTPFPWSPTFQKQDGIRLGACGLALSLRIVSSTLNCLKAYLVHPGWSIDFHKSRSCGHKIIS